MDAVFPVQGLSEQQILESLASSVPSRDLILPLSDFCKRSIPTSEYDLLSKHSSLVCKPILDVLIHLATTANSNGDSEAAYFYHRKSTLLKSCMVKGINAFFASMCDPQAAMNFFEEVGPPPGQNDSYWAQLVDIYSKASPSISLSNSLLNPSPPSIPQSLMFAERTPSPVYCNVCVPSSNFETLRSEVSNVILQKYLGSTAFPVDTRPTNLEGILELPVVDNVTSESLLSQIKERRLIIQEFTQTATHLLLNWWSSLSTSARLENLEKYEATTSSLFHPLDDITTSHQKHLLIPEYFSIYDRIDQVGPIGQLFFLVAHGKESDADGDTETLQSLETEYLSLFNNSIDNLASMRGVESPTSTSKTQLVADWILKKQRVHLENIPCILYLEQNLEKLIIVNSNWNAELKDLLVRIQGDSTKFKTPLELYRTRYLQLIVLCIIQDCLNACGIAQQSKKK